MGHTDRGRTDATRMRRPLAVVTGASGGLGYELAKQFAGHGYDLLVAAGDHHLHTAASFLRDSGTAVEAIQADLTATAGMELLADAVDLAGPVDLLAISSGCSVHDDIDPDAEPEAELDVVAEHISSTVYLVRRLLPAMIARGAGTVLLASCTGPTVSPDLRAVHLASEAFVDTFATALRHELEGTGVTVTALTPGRAESAASRRPTPGDVVDPQGLARLAENAFGALLAAPTGSPAGDPGPDGAPLIALHRR